jgi:hypothetical protein
MLRILGRGHSVPTVTELIFVRAQCLTSLLEKHVALRATIKWTQVTSEGPTQAPDSTRP